MYLSTSTGLVSAIVLLGIHAVSAQLTIDCEPLLKTCPPNPGLGGTYFYDFTKGPYDDWKASDSPTMTYDQNGMNFWITSYGQTLSLKKYIFFGNVQAWVKTMNGSGIVGSLILEADTKDEVDWEWLGSDNANTQTNYFWHAVQGKDPGIKVPTQAPQNMWHNYTIDWTPEVLTWYIDGKVVRSLTYAYADSGPSPHPSYPQSPMRVSIGGWIGCATKECWDSGQATIQNPGVTPSCEQAWTCRWAEGYLQPATGPFNMAVANVTVRDYGCGSSYVYNDMTGAMGSISGRQQCQASNLVTVTPTAGKATSTSSSSSSTSSSQSSSTTSQSGQSSSTSSGSSGTSTGTTTGTTTTKPGHNKPPPPPPGQSTSSTTMPSGGQPSGPGSNGTITSTSLSSTSTTLQPGATTPATVICSQTNFVVVAGPDGRLTIGIPPATVTDANGATMITTAPISITAGPNGQVTVSGYIPSMTGVDGTVTIFDPTVSGTKTIATSGPVQGGPPGVPGATSSATTPSSSTAGGSTTTKPAGQPQPGQPGFGSAASGVLPPFFIGWSMSSLSALGALSLLLLAMGVL